MPHASFSELLGWMRRVEPRLAIRPVLSLDTIDSKTQSAADATQVKRRADTGTVVFPDVRSRLRRVPKGPDSMLTLTLVEPHWLVTTDHPLDDQCAHGTVHLSVLDQVLISPVDGEITVSAAALNLLRTIDHGHTPDSPVAEGGQLFPCCGFNVWLGGARFPVVVAGCPSGIEMEVSHNASGVVLRRAGVEALVSEQDWRRAVVSFARSVQAFYASEPPRNLIQDLEEREGWQAFWEEFAERLQRHGGEGCPPC